MSPPCTLKIFSGEKPYICEICNQKYADKSNLNSHRRNKHSLSTPQWKAFPRISIHEVVPPLPPIEVSSHNNEIEADLKNINAGTTVY